MTTSENVLSYIEGVMVVTNNNVQRKNQVEKYIWCAVLLALCCWILSGFVGFHYGDHWFSLSLSQGEFQLSYPLETQSYSYRTQPPQGWSYFKVPFNLGGLPDAYSAFGIGYLILPLWIPVVALATTGILLRIYFSRCK